MIVVVPVAVLVVVGRFHVHGLVLKVNLQEEDLTARLRSFRRVEAVARDVVEVAVLPAVATVGIKKNTNGKFIKCSIFN